ncbi:hypothetical protein FHY64_16945 [Pelagovum pacificum]|uniref:Uncharacterized protein n=2 Tax=Pelagovum pacificum TaxID=2588711 RepID=A0A5C5G7R6_9RHOB|nr:hypothetical protein FHY64_16945 [Pelagovum pacificum]
MTSGLEFSLTSEVLDEGAPEERASFGILSIKANGQTLTEGFDHYLNGFRVGPLVSAYYLAEWLAWNWWRLRWESCSHAPDWNLVHQMNTIGEGYVWPNIQIWSDGHRSVLISRPSVRPDAKPFRYVGASPVVIPSTTFEHAVDEFMPRIIGRLRERKVEFTNLDRLWKDVLEERNNPDLAERRRLEALMGRDPDSIDDQAIESLIASRERLGSAAVDEVAAGFSTSGRRMMSNVEDFEGAAATVGFNAKLSDALRMRELPNPAEVPAWKRGRIAADLVRQQERLEDRALTDKKLAELMGASPSLLSNEPSVQVPLSFALTERNGTKSSIVLNQRPRVSRRFALARLIGDQLMNPPGSLHPAISSSTYRQKAQRSFAAELLAPFSVIDELMAGDYSEEKQQDIADLFDVSPMVINTLLRTHDKIDRDDLEGLGYLATP